MKFPFTEGAHYRVEASGCWVWTRGRKGKEAKGGGGYPCWKLDGKTIGVHRLACELRHGPLIPGQQARHLCHNTLCINPVHLAPGTQRDNMQDSAKAGRRPHKLTVAAVRAIKRACAAGVPQSVTAGKHGIAQADVSHIARGHYWAHVNA